MDDNFITEYKPKYLFSADHTVKYELGKELIEDFSVYVDINQLILEYLQERLKIET